MLLVWGASLVSKAADHFGIGAPSEALLCEIQTGYGGKTKLRGADCAWRGSKRLSILGVALRFLRRTRTGTAEGEMRAHLHAPLMSLAGVRRDCREVRSARTHVRLARLLGCSVRRNQR
jgi:hypothetical protein